MAAVGRWSEGRRDRREVLRTGFRARPPVAFQEVIKTEEYDQQTWTMEARGEQVVLHPVLAEFQELIDTDPVVRLYVNQMIAQVPSAKPYRKRHLESVEQLLRLINEVLRLDSLPRLSARRDRRIHPRGHSAATRPPGAVGTGPLEARHRRHDSLNGQRAVLEAHGSRSARSLLIPWLGDCRCCSMRHFRL